MFIITDKLKLNLTLDIYRKDNKSIGFVPTMGALHDGHISLLTLCNNQCDVSVVSIFVNPTQFNDLNDFNNYPITLDQDCALLESNGCDILFFPSVDEMYSGNFNSNYTFGSLESVMEGACRPGHFKGVAQIVSLLFDVVKPNKAYFGEKDFQQLAIIRKLVLDNKYPIEIVSCPIVREADGLAMSSRNRRLTVEERNLAPIIYKTLLVARKMQFTHSVYEIKNFVIAQFLPYSILRLEYFDIVDAVTLQPLVDWNCMHGIVGCIAIFCGKIRLIDNIVFKS